MQLGSDLTLMMLIEVDPAQSAALHVALAEHQRAMRDVHLITRTTTPDGGHGGDATQALTPAPLERPRVEQRPARFHLAALDRPGLVHTVTSACPPPACVACCDSLTRVLRAEFFAAHDVDVLDMKCEQRDAFIDGKMCAAQGLLVCAARAHPSVGAQATPVLHGGPTGWRRAGK